jgi:AcrR family transcriptional regulator
MGFVGSRPENKRRYDSPLRQRTAARTRESVLAAASRLFTERGWSGTSMRDVAREAGVAVETVYSTVGQKKQLLLRVLDVGVVGDDDPAPLAQRQEFTALAVGSRTGRLAAAGLLMRSIYERSMGPDIALREAASHDAELANRLAESRDRQRRSMRQGVELVFDRALSDAENDEIWVLLSFETYRLLVETAGWTPDRYQDWVADALGRLHPAPAGQ